MHRFIRNLPFLPIWILLLVGISVASGCAHLRQAMGQFGGQRGRIVVVIEPGFATNDRLMRLVDPIVQDAAHHGAHLEVAILSSGVVATLVPVELSAAGDGDFFPQGRNEAAWRAEADTNATAALEAIERAIDHAERDDTGAALFDALAWSAERVDELPGEGDLEVVLVTGGGVHRSSALDLVAVDFTVTSPADAITDIPLLDHPDLGVQVVGAGAFPNVQPPPDATWAAGVRDTFEAFCAASRTRSCTVTDSALTRQEEL